MDTITIKFNKATDFHIFEPLFKQFKVKILTHEISQEKDDTLMTKEEFFSMIDQARKAPTKKMTKEKRKKILGCMNEESIYEVFEGEGLVKILSAYGHYDDK